MYLFQFDIVFSSPDRVDECEFNQTAENEETAAKEPHFGYFDVADFWQCFSLRRSQRDECQHCACAEHNTGRWLIGLQPKRYPRNGNDHHRWQKIVHQIESHLSRQVNGETEWAVIASYEWNWKLQTASGSGWLWFNGFTECPVSQILQIGIYNRFIRPHIQQHIFGQMQFRRKGDWRFWLPMQFQFGRVEHPCDEIEWAFCFNHIKSSSKLTAFENRITFLFIEWEFL